MTRKSTPASTSAWARRNASSPTPTAAPTSSRPSASLAARGYFSALTKSLTVIRPLRRPSSSTSGSFSILCRRSSSIASSPEMPTLPVTSGIGVMTSRTWRPRSSSKAMSRLVTMPSSRPDGVGDRNAADAELGAQRVRLAQRGVGAHRDRVGDHAGLGALDEVDLVDLVLDRQIAVQDAHAALTGHRDGHPRLGDLVHGGGHQRDVDLDVAGDAGRGVHLVRQHLGRAGQQQHVVVGEPEEPEFLGELLGHSVGVCGHDTFPNALARRGNPCYWARRVTFPHPNHSGQRARHR